MRIEPNVCMCLCACRSVELAVFSAWQKKWHRADMLKILAPRCVRLVGCVRLASLNYVVLQMFSKQSNILSELIRRLTAYERDSFVEAWLYSTDISLSLYKMNSFSTENERIVSSSSSLYLLGSPSYAVIYFKIELLIFNLS